LPNKITAVAVRLTTDIGDDATVVLSVQIVSTIIDGIVQGSLDL
jgi:hypothetical protein